MRLQILSDLHLEMGPEPYSWQIPETDADIIILAGDIGVGVDAIKWGIRESTRLSKPAVIINGNHESYRQDFDTNLKAIKQLASESSDVYFLEKDSFTYAKNEQMVEFLGTTCWTGFYDLGDSRRVVAMRMAKEYMNDYRIIRFKDRKLTPEDTAQFHNESVAWLLDQLAKPRSWPRVLVLHHGPSPACHNHEKHGSPDDMSLNFWSDMEEYLTPQSVDLVIYGHTHSNLRFEINGVPVVTNQKGYPREGVEGFDPKYIVEV